MPVALFLFPPVAHPIHGRLESLSEIFAPLRECFGKHKGRSVPLGSVDRGMPGCKARDNCAEAPFAAEPEQDMRNCDASGGRTRRARAVVGPSQNPAAARRSHIG
jgi:hypothetical protein